MELPWGRMVVDFPCLYQSFEFKYDPGTPVSSTNNADRYDITEILLKVALSTINLSLSHIRKFINVNIYHIKIYSVQLTSLQCQYLLCPPLACSTARTHQQSKIATSVYFTWEIGHLKDAVPCEPYIPAAVDTCAAISFLQHESWFIAEPDSPPVLQVPAPYSVTPSDPWKSMPTCQYLLCPPLACSTARTHQQSKIATSGYFIWETGQWQQENIIRCSRSPTVIGSWQSETVSVNNGH
jgi:hypothetical protein